MFEGVDSWDKDPRKSLHVDEVATPELAPDEVYIAVMASSINFNTVWTSIFEPLPTFGFLDKMGRQNEWGKRHALPYHVVGSDASAVVVRVGSAVRNWKPGDRVTVHCNYVDDQDPSAHNDSMLATNQLIWGFETNFGAPRRPRRGQGQPADAEADPPDVGRGGGQRPVQLDVVSDAGQRERRPDEAGRQRADLGRHRRHRRLRRAVRAQRWRHTDRRRVVARACRTAQPDGLRGGHRPPRRELPVLVRREHPGRIRVAPLRQEDPRAQQRRGRRHRVRASRSFHDGRLDLRRQARRHGRHLRRDVGLHGRVRQPPLLDEAEEPDRLALRQLRRVVRRQQAARPGSHPAAADQDLHARPGRRGVAGGAPQRGRRQARRAVPGARRKASASTTPRSASASAKTRSPSSARDLPCRGPVGHGRHAGRHRALLVRHRIRVGRRVRWHLDRRRCPFARRLRPARLCP